MLAKDKQYVTCDEQVSFVKESEKYVRTVKPKIHRYLPESKHFPGKKNKILLAFYK